MFDIEEELKKLPSKPGVYIMHDKNDKIIYVGKAISLKNRVTSYFRKTNKTKRIENMVKLIDHFEYIVVDNEQEALILECNLIKKYPNETKFLNMASKETSKEVEKEIKDIFSEYHKKSNEKLKKQISNSIKIFNLRKDIDHELVVDALSLYIDAIVIKHLNQYQDNPMDLFDNYDEFKNSISKYLGLMLNGFLNTDCLR